MLQWHEDKGKKKHRSVIIVELSNELFVFLSSSEQF